ncbi:MAG: magnesium chelatase family protein [Oceanicoccus sp.]|jgi:magnesium chelatase family protein
MSLAIVYTRAKFGIDAPPVTVEVHLSNGLPAFNIVGLPETAVKESKDRVRSAIINSHFEFPSRRITINLAPADLPKEGGRYDLPIALGILAASKQIPIEPLSKYEFLGELALTGAIRPIQGSLSAAIKCSEAGRALVIPTENSGEATLCRTGTIFCARNLLQLSAHLHSRELLTPEIFSAITSESLKYPDLDEVRGQPQARRALEISAAGGHNIIFCGPPGTGKTMLASRLPGILPPLTQQEMLEVATVFSISDNRGQDFYQRPFRNPHHTASAVALVGGGSHPKPGEISLAHHGILFLDELPEFQRQVLEVLREPLESGEIMISRASQQVRFPAKFQLVAAMNPCPCGYYGDNKRACRCTPDRIRRYREKISGPLIDRIDIQLNVSRLPAKLLRESSERIENSEHVLSRVIKARKKQLSRAGKINAALTIKELESFCLLDNVNQNLLENAVNKLNLSPRAYHRILRVARTIADMEEADTIASKHLLEATGYRALDRNNI